MYLLQFLKNATADDGGKAGAVTVEHRLACSGELYNARVQTASGWRKSDITRVLSLPPVELFVVSRPFDAYPQELCVRLALDYATEEAAHENISFRSILLPDDEIVEDLCSVLSLLSRRLIAPAAVIGERRSDSIPALGSFGSDVPLPVLGLRYTVWKPRGCTVVMRGPQYQEVISYAPPPVGVLPDLLHDLLLKLPSLAESPRIIRAARLYREALELIETRPDSAYQLLISVAETMSNATPPDYEPTEQDRLESKRPVYDMAVRFGLDPEKAKKLALKAADGNRWTKRKFKAFLSSRVRSDELTIQDRVFHPLEHLCPSPSDFGKALGAIYDLRSGNLHEGRPLPRSVRIGIGPMIPTRDLPLNPLEPPDIPPVVWFERVVSLAVRRYVLQYTATPSCPFVDPTLPGAADSAQG